MSDTPKLCRISDDGSEFHCCEAMDQMLQEALAHKKGLVPLFVVNRKTHKQRFLCVTYRDSSRDPGIALNVCPWCEERIDAGMEGR